MKQVTTHLNLCELILLITFKYICRVCACAAQAEAEKTGKKTDKKKELDELNELFKPVVAAQKVSKGNQHTACKLCKNIPNIC